MIVTIADILGKEELERKIESRFPVRVIFCDSLVEYRKLVTRLRGACDYCWNISEFCSEKYPDRYPKFRKLLQRIEENSDKHILLLSVGEYLRMATKFEIYGDTAAQFMIYGQGWNHLILKPEFLFLFLVLRNIFTEQLER